MITYSRPPLINTNLSPYEIIGNSNNLDLFTSFIAITSSSTNNGEWPKARLNKEVGAENLPAIAAVLGRLRENGYYPDGIDHNGAVRWRTALKSESQEIFESGLKELEGKGMDELIEIGKAIRSVSRSVDGKEYVTRQFVELVDAV